MKPFSFFRFAWLLVVAVFLAACSSTPPAPKPKEYPALPEQALKLKRLWKISVGDGLADEAVRLAPALTEQYVAAASRDGMLVLVNRDTGKVIWKKDTDQPLVAGPGAAYGSVVVGTAKGEVLAFSPADGSLQWRATLGAVAMATPAISSDTVVVLAADGVVHALARDNGQERWTYNTTVPTLSLHANAAPLIRGSHVYVASSSGKLASLDLASGVAEWDLSVATNDGRSELERMNDIVADLLDAGPAEVASVGYQSQLTLTDTEAGRRLWSFDVSSVNNLAEGLGNIYVTDIGGNVLAVDKASGKALWKQPDYAYRRLTNPVVLSNHVVVGDDDGRVHLLAQSDGAVRGRVRIGGDALVALQVRDDVLYAWDEDGGLSAWKLK